MCEVEEYDFDWCRIEFWVEPPSIRTVFYDGVPTALMLSPVHDLAQTAKAMRLGYTGDENGIALMIRDRCLIHTRLAVQMGLPWSPALYSEALIGAGIPRDDVRITPCEERVESEQYVLKEMKRLNAL